jgi:transcriptional regulator with XRE-family HTH domain
VTRPAKFTHRPKFDGKEKERRKQLGELLRRARRQADLTQAAVARTLGYTRQSKISEIEAAKRTLDPIELENFAHLYGKGLNEFATWSKDQPSTEELRERANQQHKEALKLQRAYSKKAKDKRREGR